MREEAALGRTKFSRDSEVQRPIGIGRIVVVQELDFEDVAKLLGTPRDCEEVGAIVEVGCVVTKPLEPTANCTSTEFVEQCNVRVPRGTSGRYVRSLTAVVARDRTLLGEPNWGSAGSTTVGLVRRNGCNDVGGNQTRFTD